MIRNFRLTNEPDGLGLSCTTAGLSLAGVPLLRKTKAGFAPRPAPEIASLVEAAYGADPTRLQSSVGMIAEALNRGDFARAMIAAVLTRTPELSREAASRLAGAEKKLSKYLPHYNPNEPRDWEGRWTTDGAGGPSAPAGARQASRLAGSDADWRELLRPASFTLSDDEEAEGDKPRAQISLRQTFEEKYNGLAPTGFAKEAPNSATGWDGKAATFLRTRGRMRAPNIPFFRIAFPSGSTTTTSLRKLRRT
jgi:hypothetical protein